MNHADYDFYKLQPEQERNTYQLELDQQEIYNKKMNETLSKRQPLYGYITITCDLCNGRGKSYPTCWDMWMDPKVCIKCNGKGHI